MLAKHWGSKSDIERVCCFFFQVSFEHQSNNYVHILQHSLCLNQNCVYKLGFVAVVHQMNVKLMVV